MEDKVFGEGPELERSQASQIEPAEEETKGTNDEIKEAEVCEGETLTDVQVLSETPVKTKTKKGLRIGICAVLILALAAAAWYFINDGWLPRENNVLYKDSYTVSEEEAVKNADKVVAAIEDKELTNGLLQMYYWMQVYDFIDYWGNYTAYFGMDFTQPLDTQQYPDGDGTWQQYFLEVGIETWQRYQVLNLLADEAGYELSDYYRSMLDAMPDRLAQIAEDSGYESATAMLQTEMGPACTMDDYLDYLRLFYRGYEYFELMYRDLNPSDAQIEEYFLAHVGDFEEMGVTQSSGPMASVRHILIQPEGGSMDESGNVTYTDEAWAACLTKAQELLDSWKAGEATQESFALLANTHSADAGSNTTGGLYTDVWIGGNYVEPFTNWSVDESRQAGDTGLVQTDYGYHIMYFVSSEPVWVAYARSSLLTEMSNQLIEDAMEAYPITVKYRNIVLGEVDMAS